MAFEWLFMTCMGRCQHLTSALGTTTRQTSTSTILIQLDGQLQKQYWSHNNQYFPCQYIIITLLGYGIMVIVPIYYGPNPYSHWHTHSVVSLKLAWTICAVWYTKLRLSNRKRKTRGSENFQKIHSIAMNNWQLLVPLVNFI